MFILNSSLNLATVQKSKCKVNGLTETLEAFDMVVENTCVELPDWSFIK